MSDWRRYQERVAAFFRSLGLDAETDVTLQGVRTAHEVDVVVRSRFAGFDALWLVECKHWQSRVSKLHVLGLRQIVHDVGADRGLIMAEGGFQAGAVEAAQLTNVTVSSLAQLARTTASDVLRMRTRDLADRVDACRTRYWAINKQDRIQLGLRADVYELGYSGQVHIEGIDLSLREGLAGKFPIKRANLAGHIWALAAYEATSAEDLIAVVEPAVSDLERRLDVAEAELRRRTS